MYALWSSHSFLAALLLCFFLQDAVAIVLQPIRPVLRNGDDQMLGKREDVSALDLRSVETFFWGGLEGPSDAIVANLTVYMPSDVENILSMEKFYGMLTSVDCADHNMTLAFKDDATFAYAQKVWDWVNGADDHTFIMVAGIGDCGWNTERRPFSVSKITYDEDRNIARLTAELSDWKSIAHTYDLHVGHVPLTDSQLPARDVSKDVSLDVSTVFPFGVKVTQDGLSSALECSKCGTTGQINIELKLSTKAFIPTGASMRMSPNGVSAKAELKLTASGELTKSISFKKTVASIPLNSIKIPGDILNIGPFLDVAVGFEVSAVTGSASITGGAIVTIPDSAIVELDLLNPSKNKFSGWGPSVDTIPITVDAKISGAVQIFAQPALKLVAEAIGQGYEIGLKLKMPYIDAKLEGIRSPTGACKSKHEFGVKIGSNIGAELKLEASHVKDENDPIVNVTIATVAVPLAEKCFAFGPLVGGGGSGPSPEDPPAVGGGAAPSPTVGAGATPSDPAGSSGAASCRIDSGLSGKCISTSACSAGGGNSEPGHCAGAANIQCCTYPPKASGSDDSCKIDSGLSGKCMSTNACSEGGGKSEPGHCPGAADIQCCTYPPKAESKAKSSDGSCTITSGQLGECVSTSACSSAGGKSEPGHCPGGTNIQCCTYGSCAVGKTKGLCQSTSSCSGKSTPDLCPGAADIQCCTT